MVPEAPLSIVAPAASILGLTALAALVGGMIFFVAIMAPTIFTVLDGEQAARLIRRVFPRYYLYLLICAGLSAIGFLFVDRPSAVILAVIAAASVWLRQGLMPAINRRRDAQLAGDLSAKRQFDQLHRLSVMVNMAQLLVALAVTIRIALR